jgi:Putative adhesin
MSRNIGLRVGAVITGLLIIVGALNLFSLMAGHASTTTTSSFPAASTGVSISAGSADVTVLPGGSGAINVVRRASTERGRSVAAPTMTDGVLSLPGNCHSSALGWLAFCSVRYVVNVPTGVPLTLRNSSGDVTVDGLTASRLDLQVGSGDISVSRVTTPDLVAVTSSGDLTLSFAQDPTTVKATVGSGDLRVLVPGDGQAYAVDGNTGSGDYHNELNTQLGSTHTIVARTGSGDLTLSYAG